MVSAFSQAVWVLSSNPVFPWTWVLESEWAELRTNPSSMHLLLATVAGSLPRLLAFGDPVLRCLALPMYCIANLDA